MTPATLAALARGDLANALIAATPGGIEAQERAGQQAEALRATLPIDLNTTQFEAAGFQLGPPVDDLFCAAIFPLGWKKVPTDHAMWSDIVDPAGIVRGAIFYKAAFYDRRATAHLNPRFSVHKNFDERRVYIADKRGRITKEIAGLPKVDWSDLETRVHAVLYDNARTELCTWLDERYPGWNDPTKYWE